MPKMTKRAQNDENQTHFQDHELKSRGQKEFKVQIGIV